VPKRVLDGEGFWGSRKLRRCPVWIRREYPYLYPLADCNGNFELDIPVILGKLKPNRPDLSVRKLETIFKTFENEGVAFVWNHNKVGQRQYVHWTGSERVGRLPRLSRRSNKYEKRLAPPLPQKEYEAYLQRFGETLFVSGTDTVGNQARASARAMVTDRVRVTWFDKFWKAYPRKVGKPAAWTAWKKAYNTFDLSKLLAGLERWKATEQWQKEDGKFIPYPATFLNQRRWEDDPPGPIPLRELSAVQPQTEHCSGCGAEIPAGFLMCLKCLKKQAPVNT
jgi:hypothetical protein